MSGVLSAIQSAGRTFAGYGELTLGPVKFSGVELPAKMPIGGKQAIAVFNLPGGARVLQSLGAQENTIGWRGILYAQNQSARARALDKLRQSGKPIKLVWGDYAYTVVVESFHCDTRIVGPMHYAISCVVVKNDSRRTGTSLISVFDQVTTDLRDGNPVGALSSVSQGVSLPIGNAQAAAGLSGAMKIGTEANKAAVSAINEAASVVRKYQGEADSLVQQYAAPVAAALGVNPSSLSLQNVVGSVGSLAQSAGDSANLWSASGYIGRALRNAVNGSA